MQTLNGQVERIVFANESTGFTVLEVRAGKKLHTAVGLMPFIREGEEAEFQGVWVEHRDFGTQLKVEQYSTITPSTEQGIIRYLGSGLIKGIGMETARRIVKKFGVDTLRIMDTQIEKLLDIRGVGEARLEMIRESYREQSGMRQALVFLQNYGFSPGLCMRIAQTYGLQTQAIIKNNPYRLSEDVQGVGFRTADRIALAMGFPADSPYRMSAGVRQALSDAMQLDGHSYLPRELLEQSACQLLEADGFDIHNTIDEMIISKSLFARKDSQDTQCIYLPAPFLAEEEAARRLRAMIQVASAALEYRSVAEIDADISQFEQNEEIQFGAQQRRAILHAVRGRLLVITGGPGTGKTTIINCIIRLLNARGRTVLLAAPTGRAARRMSEATGGEAKTVHRLLEYGQGDENDFARDDENPLEADVVIVDEMSMMDIFLFRSLLRALNKETGLIMVGDVDQLPSVGVGNVLRDCIDSNVLPVARLTEIYRQAAKSLIILGAHAINAGRFPELNHKDGDFFLERKSSQPDAARTIVELCVRRLPQYQGFDPLRDIQVLAPLKKGDAGVYALNAVLQEALNPPTPGKKERQVGQTLLREGDKVMQTKNDYEIEWERNGEIGQGVFNGDVGFVEKIDPKEHSVRVRFDDDRLVEFEEAKLEALDLAYAVTVHKSQGSEFPCVVVAVAANSPLLMTRNLLYTAVTRARKLVVLVGREDIVRNMICNNRVKELYSGLRERLERGT